MSHSTSGVYSQVDQLLQLRHLAQGLILEARRQSQALLDGSVRTRYKGRGMEFAEVRPYQAGDDIRSIDWRVTARMQAPYTKLYQEEHERPVFVMADQRSNMFFGSKRCMKSVFAAELCALIAWIAAQNNDRVGALVFGDTDQKDIRARRGKHAVMELLNRLTEFNHALNSPIKPEASQSLEEMLEETSRIARPGSKIVLVSDFHDFNASCRKPLAFMAKRSDLIAINCYDPLEMTLPAKNIMTISNGKTRMTLDTKALGEKFTASFKQQQEATRQAFANLGVQYAEVSTDTDIKYFAQDFFRPRPGGRKARSDLSIPSLRQEGIN